MPVLVTAAHRTVGRRLALRLLEEGGEVRAYSDGATATLRAAGAFVASGTADDEGRLEAAMTDVHTVVHVAADLMATDATALVAHAEVVARAASSAGVRRLLLVSLPGAAADADDPLRRASHAAEVAAAAAEPPSIVLRPSLVDTPALRDLLATGGLTPEEERVTVAPVRLADVVELVVAFDRARSRAERGHLVVAADGPVRTTLGDYLDRVGARAPGALLGRRLTDPDRVPLLRPALAGPWSSDDPVLLDGWAFAHLAPAAPWPDASGAGP
jgi:uncharacterized protein YbjT (DUF2867 family)